MQDSFLFSPVYVGQGNYHWLFGDGDASSLQSPYHSYQLAGTWAVSLNISDSNGCRESSSQVISTIGLTPGPSSKERGDVVLFPNPNSGSFTLETPNADIYSITDLTGKTIQTGNLNAGTNSLNLNAASGCYILQVGRERMRLMVW